MQPAIDASAPVRPGEELDLARLEPYLLERIPGARGPLDAEQFPGGFSNLTYLLRLGGEELVLRRPPFGNRVKSAHDMGREFRVLSRLHPVYPLAPRALLHCADESVLGAPFYVMERRRGVIPHRRVAAALDLGPEVARRLSEAFIDNLATLHTLDFVAAGLGDLGRPEGYGRRQVDGWTERYQRAATGDQPELTGAFAWLDGHLPPAAPASLVHNDYKVDNLVLDPEDLSRIVAVLDWEMATVGDPLFDLGTTLAYWLEADEGSPLAAADIVAPAFPGSLCRRELAARYGAATGTDLGEILFHYVFGLAKIAVIVQQIYARFRKGLTRDRRFAGLGEVVGILGGMAMAALEKGDL